MTIEQTDQAQADLLATIVAATRRIVAVREQREPLAELERRGGRRPVPGRRFLAAVSRTDRVNVIAECKRRSPSRGVLRADYDPVSIARSYAEAGAAAISVLTEPTFFDGSLEHLEAVRAAVDVPLLRKDFVVSEYQLFEARAAGADAVLLIVSILAGARLGDLLAAAKGLGLAALVECHTAAELDRALTAGARVVGINNRDLATFETRIETTLELLPLIPPGPLVVSESGFFTGEQVRRVVQAGAPAVLVGEGLVRADDVGAKVRELRLQ